MPVLASGLDDELVELHADENHGRERAGAQGVGVVLLRDVLVRGRHGVDQLAHLEVLRLDRLERDVVDDADAGAPDGARPHERRVGVERPHVAQDEHDRQRQKRDGAEQRVADHRAAPDARLLGAGLEGGDGAGLLVRGRLERVALLHHLDVGHELARPLHGADADEEQREAQGEPQCQVGGLEPGQVALDERQSQVGDDEADAAQRRDAEHGRDLALGALGRLGVGVGEARLVRRDPRVGQGIAGLLSRLELGPVRRHADVSSRFTVALRAPIQAAAAMSTPRPITQTHRPSLTGPMRPMPRPPGLGSLSMLSR